MNWTTNGFFTGSSISAKEKKPVKIFRIIFMYIDNFN